MKNERIAQALGQLFDKQRIVFWYDTQQEFAAEFAALDLPGVEKITLANNEFGVKYRVLRGQPTQKFLLFRPGPQPEHLHNWLLDVQLASGTVFRTDQVALWLAELGLGPQGLTGNNSVMGVNIESSARHPSTIGVAVSTGCWAHRRGRIRINADMSYEVISHQGFKL